MVRAQVESSDAANQNHINFDKVYKALSDIPVQRSELIIAEDPASKTNKQAIQEVRSILKHNLPDMFGSGSTVEVVDQPLVDDFMNLIEVACSVKPSSASSEDDS